MSAASEPIIMDDVDIWYRLDKNDRIVGVGGAWHDSSGEHERNAVTGDHVVGTLIYSHVAGHFTRKFLKDFLDRARLGGQARLSYRCDSPTLKKLVQMRALPEDGESLLVTHHTLEENPLPHPVHLRHVSRRLATSLRCSVCNRLRRKNETAWLEPEQAVVSGQTALVIHTVCSDCRKSIVSRQAGISVPLMVT